MHATRLWHGRAAAARLCGALRIAPRSRAAHSSASDRVLPENSFRSHVANERRATLVLEDGSRMTGYSFGHEGPVAGELVFQTGMAGYTEALTDPSYKGQMLINTYPLVGNYGVPDTTAVDPVTGLHKYLESDQIHVQAYLVSDYCHTPSHWNSTKSLGEWLKEERIPGIYGLDTRLLTQKVRDKGSMLARIEFEGAYEATAVAEASFENVNARNLVAEVSRKEVVVYGENNSGPTILAVDCGIKNNIIRCFLERDCVVRVVPWDYDFTHDVYDGLFLSNGPGNPEMADVTIKHLKAILDGKGGVSKDKPLFGICLGNQLLGLAAGAKTFKLPFGNRGQNQPVINELTGQCFITPQNHGYALDATQLPEEFVPLFTNRNDFSNEGIMHVTRPIFTAQFHPEAWGGPTDTQFMFDMYKEMMVTGKGTELLRTFDQGPSGPIPVHEQEQVEVKKILLLGSGGLSIGQAGEFDYSGNQAIKALKEERTKDGSKIEVVLMNPNIASVQTNPQYAASLDSDELSGADTTYFMPVTPKYVEDVIRKEKPDGLVLSMGGQTALNCGVELFNSGILEKYNVKVLGTSVPTIITTEDRELFKDEMDIVAPGKSARSRAVTNLQDALETAETIGFPVMIRSAFALGGLGSGICEDVEELTFMASKALTTSPQILVEESLLGWKEVEYEVVRDAANNCITVCNMENFDPMGVHTGDSMVVAPSQTLSNEEYQILRNCALDVVRHLGIVGECNIQYALDPNSTDFRIIEVNPRLSRSSALASKATGYPLAFVAAKLALGKQLPDLRNSVTQTTTACFEPSLDYIVTKVPRWDLTKFDKVSRQVGSAMQSVGEVMAIGRSFEESFQKALRMVEPTAYDGFQPHDTVWDPNVPRDELEDEIVRPTDRRVYALAKAFDLGYSVEELHELSNVDHWFLSKLQKITDMRKQLQECTLRTLSRTQLENAKKAGFADVQIASALGCGEMEVRGLRLEMGVTPVVKQIDTTGAETPAKTNYLYTTYHGMKDDLEFEDKGVMVLGSGAYRIGSSVEFDWCSVSCIRTLRKLGHKNVLVNYNPETVSTDYDECDRLYFDELSLERVLDIYHKEGCASTIVSVGGQIPNGLALTLDQQGVNILGTSPHMIDTAEDRQKFSDMCDEHEIDQPRWDTLSSAEAAFNFADEVGYPVLVRPSYVLSGAAMNVAYTAGELNLALSATENIGNEHPVVISKFIENAREIDIDAVAQNGEVVCHAMSEHVENAGVHSGDATLVMPTQTVSEEEIRLTREITRKMAKALNISGPFNMQLIAKDGEVKVIECNLRASRSLPFSSKAVGTDFIEKATRVMVGATGPEHDAQLGPLIEAKYGLENESLQPQGYVAVKAPMFSFHRLKGADPTLGVEMSSTGEVGCFGRDKEEAFVKAFLSTGVKLPEKRILVSIQSRLRQDFLPTLNKLTSMGYELYATEETATTLQDNDIPVTQLHWDHTGMQPCIDDYLTQRKIEMVMMFSNQFSARAETNYTIRRLSTDFNIPLITNVQVAEYLVNGLEKMKDGGTIEATSLQEYWAMDDEACKGQ